MQLLKPEELKWNVFQSHKYAIVGQCSWGNALRNIRKKYIFQPEMQGYIGRKT